MWSEQLFKEVAQSCRRDATIATFTAAGFVRRGLIAAGFTMRKRKGFAKKREMLVGQITATAREQAACKQDSVKTIGESNCCQSAQP